MADSRFVYVTYIRTTPEKLWQALTDPEFTRRYWCEVVQESDWKPGASWKSIAPDGRIADSGEILEFDPPRLLEYTWIADWHADKQRGTVVRWELVEDATGTHVKVTHSGLASEHLARKDYRGGWTGVVTMLKSFLEKRSDGVIAP